MESPSKIFAAVLGLTAFAVATVAGLANGAAGGDILLRAIVCMIVCYPIGLMLGLIAGHAVDEHVASYKQNHKVRAIPSIVDSDIIDVDVA